MKSIVFDIEADGFLTTATKTWCIAAQDFDTGEEYTFPSKEWVGGFKDRLASRGDLAFDDLRHEIEKGVEFLLTADVLIGHNICGSDIPWLEKMFNVSFEHIIMWDTLIAARMLVNNEHERFTLKHFGEFLGEPKGEFEAFDMLTPEMLTYCQQDVRTTVKLTKYLLEKKKQYNVPSEAFRTDMKFAYILSHQVRSGFRLDIKKAVELAEDFNKRIDELASELSKVMPAVINDGLYTSAKKQGRIVSENGDVFVYKTSKKGDVKTAKIKYDEPNPNSKQQVIDFFINKYGWTPTEFTDKNNPKIDETILKGLKYPEAEKFIELFTVHKKKSQLYTSRKDQQGWLQSTINGRVHGTIHVNGAVTGRCTHSCVPLDSLALTKDGWKSYSDLKIGDEVLGFDFNTKTKKWTKVTAVNVYQNAPVGELGNDSVRLRCTDNHRWVTYQKNRRAEYYRFKEAKDLKKYDAILTNAPYENNNLNTPYQTPVAKYNYPHVNDITRFDNGHLNAFMTGFLLADGYLKKSTNGEASSWSFAQAEGEILEAVRIGMYLYSSTRISTTCKTKLKGPNQRYGYNITQTQCSHVRSARGMKWTYTNNEAVWCPTTELGTWVMKQGDIITITGNSPNLAQCDKGLREVWIPSDGMVLVSCDASGLEMRGLAHFLHMYDKGALSHLVASDADIHTSNQQALGFKDRDSAKTFLYALMYGAGDTKLGSIAVEDGNVQHTTQVRTLRRIGAAKRKDIDGSLVGLSVLTDRIKTSLLNRGYLLGLDKRPLFPRGEHSALNTLIQGAGAHIMKVALNLFWNKSKKFKYGEDWQLVANVHDEIVFEARPEIAEEMGKHCVESIVEAGKVLNFMCPLDAKYQIGANWAAIH